MGLKVKFNLNGVETDIKRHQKRLERIVQDVFAAEGEKLTSHIRNRSKQESWIDQTGNLRSSVGYVVVKNGVKVGQSSFSQVKGGAEGAQIGKTIAEQRATEQKANYAVSVVAGMEYAEFVEAHENKDVLASAKLMAQDDIATMEEDISIRFDKGIK